MIRGVDSLTQWYAESSTLRIGDTRSRWLSNSTIRGVGDSLVRGVDDSPYHRYGEFSFKKFNCQLSLLVMRGVADSSYQWCGELATPLYHWYAESATCHIGDSGESFFQYEYLIEFEAKIGTARKVVYSKGTNFCKNPRKSASLPCPFKRFCHTHYPRLEQKCSTASYCQLQLYL